MPTFDITLNIYVFLLIIVFSALLGFLPRSYQLAKKQRKIMKLESEMVQAHAETLEAQQDLCALEDQMKVGDSPAVSSKPVIAMKGKTRPTGTD